MTPAIRVLVREMPPLLRGVLETAVSGHRDMELLQPGDPRTADHPPAPDVILIGQRDDVADRRAGRLLSQWPGSVIVEIEVSGRGVRMHELKPHKTEFSEMSPQELIDTICAVVRCRGAEPMRDLADAIVGVSPSMVALRAYLPKVAQSRATVLITGATGSGKERIAQAIHAIGPRAQRPFVPINCATLPDGLIESELFGHERGAFTGAVAAARGQIVHADGGTLFLDEIGEMQPHTQAKLLRVLESREVRPVGAARPISVDVRVIAATNQPLEDLVASAGFRADLYYRLNVVRLDLPPLKDRPEDIPPLFQYAVQQMNAREQRQVGPPDAELTGSLIAHDWPGNVRELNNLVEAIFVDPPEGEIGLRHLPPAFRQIFARYQFTPDIERTRLISALEDTNWNKAEAAKRLQWSRMTLYRKLSLYRLDRSS